MKQKLLLLIIFLMETASCSFSITGRDSLHLYASGGALIHYFREDRPGAIEEGMMTAGCHFTLHENVSASAGVKLSRLKRTGVLEQAYLTYSKGGAGLSFGMITGKYGEVQWYDIHSPFGPWFDRWLLRDSWGTGFKGEFNTGNHSLSCRVTINGRESGAADMALISNIPSLKSAILLFTAFDTYDNWFQDNVFSAGGRVITETGNAGIHGLFVFRKFFGFDHQRNPTMVPGTGYETALEVCYKPFDKLTTGALINYSSIEKQVRTSTLKGAVYSELPFHDYCIPGVAWEHFRATLLSNTIRVYWSGNSRRNRYGWKLGFDRIVTSATLPGYAVAGNVWFYL